MDTIENSKKLATVILLVRWTVVIYKTKGNFFKYQESMFEMVVEVVVVVCIK